MKDVRRDSNLTIRVPQGLRERLERHAKANFWSLGDAVNAAVTRMLDDAEKAQGGSDAKAASRAA